jgi:hypothetical protein
MVGPILLQRSWSPPAATGRFPRRARCVSGIATAVPAEAMNMEINSISW